MSNPESFIDEVTEEVRRDKLFAMLRKYGWVGVTLVLLLVGGAAVNEYLKARATAKAEATGNAILAAVEATDSSARLAAIEAIPAEGDQAALLTLIAAAEGEDPAEADQRLAKLADDTALPQIYRDLATLKRAMISGGPMSADARLAALTPLAQAGGPFRALAEEQIALAELAQGNREAAITRLQALLSAQDASGALRRRASQLIVALGATPNGA